jgi:hypothetical protein
VIPSGTLLNVNLVVSVDSDKTSAGDLFWANLSEAVMSDGTTVLQKGHRFRDALSKRKGRAE